MRVDGQCKVLGIFSRLQQRYKSLIGTKYKK